MNFQQEIEKLMKGSNIFTIFLRQPVKMRTVGASIESGSHRSHFTIFPEADKIKFIGNQVEYTRTYPTFIPAVSEFTLSLIKDVK